MMNYLQQNIGKLQVGGMPQTGIDPQMLAQMMSAQGAGQGIDYNGEPTPNVSGEPSFADMEQEIQGRYDKLIIPLQNKLEKLKEKLKENPTDQTIKNEIQRLEQRIDQLEQQEDMELQQLEAEVEKSGEMIDQQKQMQGIEMPVQDEEMPEYMPQEAQQMPQNGMPMMQGGGNVPKKQIGEWLSDKWNAIKSAFSHDDFYKSPRSQKEHAYNAQDFVRDYNQAMEQDPVAARVVQWNPILGLSAAAMNLYSQAKGYRNDNEFVNNLSRAATGLMPMMKVASAPAALRGIAGYTGLNAAANTYANQQLEKQGQPPIYDKGFSGLMNDAYGIPTWMGELGAIFYGGNKLGMRPGNLYSGGAPAGARAETIVQKVKNKYGANWKKIEGLDTYTDRTSAGNTKLWEKLENGELEIVDNGNGGHVIREVKKPEVAAEPKFDWENATAKEAFKQRMRLAGTAFDPFWKATNEWHFEPVGKNGEPGALGRNVIKGINFGLSEATRPISHLTSFLGDATLGSLFHLQRPGFMRSRYTNPTIAGFSKGWNSAAGPRKYFSYNWSIPESIGAKRNTVLKNIKTPLMIDASAIGGALLFNKFHNENEQLETEHIKNSAAPVQELNSYMPETGDTIRKKSVQTEKQYGSEKIDLKNWTVKSRQLGGVIKKHQSDPELKEKWYADFKNNYAENHPVGLAGFLKETPYTEYGVWGNAIGKLIDDAGRHNIEAQNQFRYNSNPYTAVYDRANRDYNDALSMANARYDLRENMLRRMQPVQEYGSLQQAQNARLAQQTLLNQQIAQNENDRNSAIASIQGTYGKSANDAYTSMREQDYKNAILNENLRKTYLQSLDTYRKEKQAQFDQLVNMAAITGNRRKQADLFNAEFVPNLLNAAIAGVDYSDLLKLYQQHYPYYTPQKNS